MKKGACAVLFAAFIFVIIGLGQNVYAQTDNGVTTTGKLVDGSTITTPTNQ